MVAADSNSKFNSIANGQFAEDRLNVIIDGLFGDKELLGNLAIGTAAGN